MEPKPQNANKPLDPSPAEGHVASAKRRIVRRLLCPAAIVLGLGTMFSCGGRHSSTAKGGDSVEQAPSANAIPTDFVQDLNGYRADTMVMVTDEQGIVVGRYVRTNADTYTIAVQDVVEVPIAGCNTAVFRAKDGQGILYTRRTHVNIRQEPNTESAVVTQISCAKGGMPEVYPCLGKAGEWFRIDVKGKVGYVRQDLVEWDGMSSF